MIRELHLSADAGKGFEGEMAALSGYSRCRAACKAAWEQLACSNLLPADSDVLLASFVEYEWLQSYSSPLQNRLHERTVLAARVARLRGSTFAVGCSWFCLRLRCLQT